VSERLVVGALTLAIALVVPAILLADGLRLVTGDWYVRAVYEHGGVPKDDFGPDCPAADVAGARGSARDPTGREGRPAAPPPRAPAER
jgi:hypothetical protein